MIVVVKQKDYKRIIVKATSLLVLVGMFTAYYFHMSKEFSKETKKAKEMIVVNKKATKKQKRAKRLEKIIFREAETAVELIGQENVIDVKIVGKHLLIICDANTNLEPLMVRYGVMALVKNTTKDIKIAIGLSFIAENKYVDEDV